MADEKIASQGSADEKIAPQRSADEKIVPQRVPKRVPQRALQLALEDYGEKMRKIAERRKAARHERA